MYLEGLLFEGVLYPKRIFCEGILYPYEILREGVLNQEGYFRRDYAPERERDFDPKVKGPEGEKSRK